MLVGGCAAGRSPAPAPSQSSPSATPPVPAAAGPPDRQAAAARYLIIAGEGNRRLEIDFDRLEGRDHAALAAADADLRDAAATEHLFDRRLQAIVFPPDIKAVAHRLVAANEARACLTSAAARSTSLPQLRHFEGLLSTANRTVEQQVETVRNQLGLPPPETG